MVVFGVGGVSAEEQDAADPGPSRGNERPLYAGPANYYNRKCLVRTLTLCPWAASIFQAIGISVSSSGVPKIRGALDTDGGVFF